MYVDMLPLGSHWSFSPTASRLIVNGYLKYLIVKVSPIIQSTGCLACDAENALRKLRDFNIIPLCPPQFLSFFFPPWHSQERRLLFTMKYVLVSGGGMSGIGKGIIASSTGLLLKTMGLKVTAIKIDPYLNIGTMP